MFGLPERGLVRDWGRFNINPKRRHNRIAILIEGGVIVWLKGKAVKRSQHSKTR